MNTVPCIYCGDPVKSPDGDTDIACDPCGAACDTVNAEADLELLHNRIMIGALLAAKASGRTGMAVRQLALEAMKLHNAQWPREAIALRMSPK